MKIYNSHTAICSGWDMTAIFKNTCFQKAARTNAVCNKGPAESDVKMLDWDFRGWQKNPGKIEQDHLQNTKDYSFDVVMSMDLWPNELIDYQLAYPNANWFASNFYPPADYRDLITHILGGSPQSQIKHLTTTQHDLFGHSLRFRNVESIDGNQIFNVAIRVGKEWFPDKPYWRKPETDTTNEQIFKNSVHRLDKRIKKLFS